MVGSTDLVGDWKVDGSMKSGWGGSTPYRGSYTVTVFLGVSRFYLIIDWVTRETTVVVEVVRRGSWGELERRRRDSGFLSVLSPVEGQEPRVSLHRNITLDEIRTQHRSIKDTER